MPGVDFFGHARLAVGHFVVRLGVDHAAKRVVVEAMQDRVAHGVHVASSVVGGDQRLAHRMHEPGVPLRIEPGAAVGSRPHQRGVALQVLGDGDHPGLLRFRLVIDLLHQAPAFGQFAVALAPVHAPDVRRRIPPQPVESVVQQPVQGVVTQVRAHLLAAVVGARVAPGRATTVVVVEVDPAFVVLIPAVKTPQVEVARAEMVVDHIQQYGDAPFVRGTDEPPHVLGGSVVALNRVDEGRVVTP